MTRVSVFPLLLCALSAIAPARGNAQDSAGDQPGRAAIPQLTRSLERGDVVGRIVERTPGNYVLVPEARDLPAVPVLNPEQVGAASTGPRLSVGASYDPAEKGVRIRDYQLSPAPSALSHSRVSSPRSPATLQSPAARVLANFRGQINAALKPGAMDIGALSRTQDSTVARASLTAERELDNLYRTAVARGAQGLVDRREAVRGLAQVRQELKALYDEYDNYPPWSYERIFHNAMSVVAIAEPGQSRQALCSGVLIAEDLVLTAGHCFRSHHPEDLEVWFGFTETAGGTFPQPRAFQVVELVAPPADKHAEFLERAAEERFDADFMDYAILRFSTPEDDSQPNGVSRQCLRSHNVSRGRAIYVIGYPKGTRETVHDNGRIYLPFSLRQSQFEDLKRDIEVDFAMLEDAERLRLLEEFLASYVQRGEGPGAVYELHDTRWGRQPKVGIVADLFRGNSGSPVFDRDDHCIVGMHIGGAPDTGQRLGASWQIHETVLPVPAVLADLQKHPQTARLLEPGILEVR